MPDETDPPRKFYQLKPKAFERLNEAPTPPAGEARADARPPDSASGSIDVRDLARQATPEGPLLGAAAAAARDNEVHAMLRENHSAANAAGLNDVQPVPQRRSRRTRDYWRVLLPVNAFFLFCIFGPYANPMTFVYGVAGIILFTIGFTWVMFFIVDDY